MFKLVIADDEELVLQTLSSLIDWNSLGISVTGTCLNGIEAYHTILDDCPDIVLTDIRMPGLSGLELIDKITAADKDIEFIILSGFGEFEYAKKAMQYGVKHYLLKPCNEAQIIEVIEQVKTTCCQKRDSFAERNQMTRNLEQNMLKGLFYDCLLSQCDINSILAKYEPFTDFYSREYELCYFYYLPEQQLTKYTGLIKSYFLSLEINVFFQMLYVSHTLVLIYRSYDYTYHAADSHFQLLASEYSGEYKRNSYANFAVLLPALIQKVIRYETIFFIDDNGSLPIYNHNALTININSFVDRLITASTADHPQLIDELTVMLNTLHDTELLRALLSNMLLKIYSSLELSANSMELIQLSEQLRQCQTTAELQLFIKEKINYLFMMSLEEQRHHKDFIEKLIQYIHEHLSDPHLSLKKIAGSYLYMNADYLGKQFIKQTGYRFSTYLTNARMEKAKELLQENGSEKIYIIAELVGCGDNPQYFSQLFKRYTKMTPTEYAKKYHTH